MASPDSKRSWAANTWKSRFAAKLIANDPATVKLTAESDDKVFITVHKELLCGFSTYYRAAINGSFEEANKSSFTAKTTREALRMFGTWIYTRSFLGDKYDDGDDDDSVVINLNTLVDLYIFADMIGTHALCRDIITFWPNLNTTKARFPSWKAINKIHERLPENSPLRMFILHAYIWHWDPEREALDNTVLEEEQRLISPKFLLAVVTGKHDIMVDYDEWHDKVLECPCCHDHHEYHEHVSKEERLATCGPQDYKK